MCRSARRGVWKGERTKTRGGLTKDQLIVSKSGTIVSKQASARAKAGYHGSAIWHWNQCVHKAREELGLVGFVPVGGKTKEGRELYFRAKFIKMYSSVTMGMCVAHVRGHAWHR